MDCAKEGAGIAAESGTWIVLPEGRDGDRLRGAIATGKNAMRFVIALAMSMVAGSAFAVPNADEALGANSGFWKDWGLTASLVSCQPVDGGYACDYRITNQHGLEASFRSNGEGSEVTHLRVAKQGGEDLIFLIAAATAIKAIAPELGPERREALVKELFRTAMSDGSAETSADGWSIKIGRVFGSAWVVEGRTAD